MNTEIQDLKLKTVREGCDALASSLRTIAIQSPEPSDAKMMLAIANAVDKIADITK